jgi:hypothetical protein
MAISGKYGDINIPGIGIKEPVFVLRAQDKWAVPIIEIYKALAESRDATVAGAIGNEIERFQQWRGNKKLPD